MKWGVSKYFNIFNGADVEVGVLSPLLDAASWDHESKILEVLCEYFRDIVLYPKLVIAGC
jgi:hypothetical protein